MKAHEVLKRYEAGRRDFSRENLRGQSFKGKDLSGANFSEADIRGANFTNATLRNVNFSKAKAGMQRRWAIGLVIASWILSGLSGIFSEVSDHFLTWLFERNSTENIILVGSALIVGVILLFMMRKSFVAFAIAIAVYVALFGVFVVAVFVAGTEARVMADADNGAIAIASAFVVAVTVAVAFVVAIAGAGVVAFVVAIAVAVAVAGVRSDIIAVTIVLTCAVIFWEEYTFIRGIAIALAAKCGTSFRHADLTEADFTSATLKSTDFTKATLTRTCWHQAKKLDRVRPGTTYLQFSQVRQLLITGQGQAQTFDRQPLRGVNLQGANLADTSFTGADLSEANLQDADLSRAKLVQTQLDEADLRGATLTGAIIEDWGITSHTKLDGVRCEYVFMRVPTKEDPNPRRKPDNWNETFKDRDFADFIKPIVDTLDLYHNQDVDPRTIAISFKQLAENHPEAELEIVAMEKRGGNKFLLRVATAPDANRSELNAEYCEYYNNIKSLPKDNLIFLLSQKDGQIQSLEVAFRAVTTGLKEVAETPKYSFQDSPVYGFAPETVGSNLVSGETIHDNEIVGTQHNYTPEQRQTLAEAAAEIQQLLKQLEQTNPTATEAEQKDYLTTKIIPSTKRQRFVNALQEGGKELFKELMDNIYVNVAIAAIEGWQSAE
jgi:uncharacterized protein YjbI with pentapeptide repeats